MSELIPPFDFQKVVVDTWVFERDVFANSAAYQFDVLRQVTHIPSEIGGVDLVNVQVVHKQRPCTWSIKGDH